MTNQNNNQELVIIRAFWRIKFPFINGSPLINTCTEGLLSVKISSLLRFNIIYRIWQRQRRYVGACEEFCGELRFASALFPLWKTRGNERQRVATQLNELLFPGKFFILSACKHIRQRAPLQRARRLHFSGFTPLLFNRNSRALCLFCGQDSVTKFESHQNKKRAKKSSFLQSPQEALGAKSRTHVRTKNID